MIHASPSPPPIDSIAEQLILLLHGHEARSIVEAALQELRPNPDSLTVWADMEECIAAVLDRLMAGELSAQGAVTLLRRILQAG